MNPLSLAVARANYARWTPPKRIEPPKPAPKPVITIEIYDAREEKIRRLEAELIAVKREAGLLPTPSSAPSVRMIVALTAAYFGVSLLDITSARRTAKVVGPRQIAMYLAKKLTVNSLPEIGRRMGGRDHTTVLYGVRKIEARIEIDGDLAADVAEIKRAIETRLGQQEAQP